MTPELLFIIVCVLQVGDIYTTLRAIKLGGSEANPFVRTLMETVGLRGGLLLVKIAGLIPLFVYRDLVPMWLWAALIAFYVGVIVWNRRVIDRMR